MKDLEIMRPEPGPTGLTIEAAFTAASSRALDKESLQVMKELLAMDAERKFNAAFVAMQGELPTIVASSVIPNRGKYERFEDVMRQIQPVLTRHGFTVSFDQVADDKRIKSLCTLRHIAGHAVTTSFAVRLGGRADSETQADCKASTTAKRNALCHAINIVIRQDCLSEENDASLESSEFVTPQQADELERRCKEVAPSPADVARFLKFAGASKFSEIPAAKYAELDRFLRQKEGWR